MANIYVRSTTGATVTLPGGTQVGVIPSLIDNTSSDCQAGISAGTIAFVPTAMAQELIERSQIASSHSKGEVLLVGPTANISLAAGATYNSPSVNLLGSRSLVGFQDITNLGSNEMQSSIYMKTSTLNAIQYYTYTSSGGYQGYDPVLSNSGAGNSGIYTDQTYYSVQANPANTQAIIINGLALGVS